MNSQQLLYINIILGLLLVAYFLFGRKKSKSPTRLNLKAPDSQANQISDSESKQIQAQLPPSMSSTQNTPKIEPKISILDPEGGYKRTTGQYNPQPPPASQKTKSLSIFFMYNGHDWEAHNVLGIPQGASLHVATQAYQQLLKTADSSSLEFYEAAYNAIFIKRKNEKL